jgi:hypothetical protein
MRVAVAAEVHLMPATSLITVNAVTLSSGIGQTGEHEIENG